VLKYLVFVGAVVSFASALYYSWLTLKGRVQPNRVTWFLWFLAPMIAAVAAFSAGVTWAAVPVFMSGFDPLVVFVASVVTRHGSWKITRFDLICGGISVLALIFWVLSRNPVLAIIFSMAADFLAGVPTLSKAWTNPETEHVGPYIGGTFAAATAFFAVDAWNFVSLAFPVYLLLFNLVLWLFVRRAGHER
jgi:hypothetical protein